MATLSETLARAKKGEPRAIAALMNRLLSKLKIHVQVKAYRDSYIFHLSSEQVIRQAAIEKWILRGLRKLAIAPLALVTIYAQSQQSKTLDWQSVIWIDKEIEKALCDRKNPRLTLHQYCFIKNRSLLSYTLASPSEVVSRIILAFAALPNEQQLVIAPHVEQLLLQNNSLEAEAISTEGNAFVERVLLLDKAEAAQLAIWMSRYCDRSTETVEHLMIALSLVVPNIVTPNTVTPKLARNAAASKRSPATMPLPLVSSKPSLLDGLLRSSASDFSRSSNRRLAWLLAILFTVCFISVASIDIRASESSDTAQVAGAKAVIPAEQVFEAVANHQFPIFESIRTTPRKVETALPLKKALGIYDIFLSLGAGTLFTAVGLYAAVVWCSCYTCRSAGGLYKTASILGIIEAITHQMPVFGFIAGLAINLGAIGLASRFVKDFHVDWRQGYEALAVGAFTILAVKTVLLFTLYSAIAFWMT